MASIDGLQVNEGVEVVVHHHHYGGLRKVETEASNLGCQKQNSVLALLLKYLNVVLLLYIGKQQGAQETKIFFNPFENEI